MNTDARRKASADYHAKLKAEGHKKVTLFLSPEALAALEKLAVGTVSKAQAVNSALIAAASARPSPKPAREPRDGATPHKPSVKQGNASKGVQPAIQDPFVQGPQKPSEKGHQDRKPIGFGIDGKPIYR